MFREMPGITFCAIALIFPQSALAYVGPTLGLGVIGTAVAVVAVLLLSLFAFVFVPIRRLLKKTKKKRAGEDVES